MSTWMLRIILISVVSLCVYLRYITGGWFLLIAGIFIYVPIISVHCVFHLLYANRAKPMSIVDLWIIISSHILFILAFLLQYDWDDNYGFLAITKLLRSGEFNSAFWARYYLEFNVMVFVPVILSWIFIIKRKETFEATTARRV